ncbi:unannotated protein [freshwater metagenome]|uniref:Unannotated protein n=1 Tax=freshwater metagenome TaxID=449393 RepID=A0A6J7F2E7_9ZZZZ
MIAPDVSARRIGRSTRNWTMTPRIAPATSATSSAKIHEPVRVWTLSAMKVVNIAWPTWAKFTTRVARQMSTRASAMSAITAPLLTPPMR